MPSPKTTKTRCTGCRRWYMTTKRQALKDLHFHNPNCAHHWHIGRARSDRGGKSVLKVCRFCHSGFLAGGRAKDGKRLPNKSQLWCDNVCYGRSKENKGKECLLLSPEFARWASGFFDGDGSAFMVVEGTRKKPFVEVSIGSTDYNVICDFVRETGLGKPNFRRSKEPEQKDLHMWRCYAGGAISFLRQINPFLIVKRAIVNHVFKCHREMESDPPLAYQPDWRANALEISKKLNERGPKGARRRSKVRSSPVEQMFSDLMRNAFYSCQDASPITHYDSLNGSTSVSHSQARAGRKICPVDGKDITQPRSLTCSRKCALIFRKRRGRPCYEIHPVLRPYLAGLIDGEGCIEIRRSYSTVHARVSFGNTSKRIVDLIRRITGLGSSGKRPPKKNHSKSWHWRSQSDGAHGFIEQIYPFLRVKHRQARLALYVQNRLKDPASRCDRTWQIQAIAESHRLNQKGPQPEC